MSNLRVEWDRDHGDRHVRAAAPLRTGDLVGPLLVQRVLTAPHRHTLQLSEREHGEGLGAFAFLNHACEPSVRVDTRRRLVLACHDLQPGEELTYAYPSTEWRLHEPFDCHCGAPGCLGRVAGACALSPAQCARFWLNDHIRRLLGHEANSQNPPA